MVCGISLVLWFAFQNCGRSFAPMTTDNTSRLVFPLKTPGETGVEPGYDIIIVAGQSNAVGIGRQTISFSSEDTKNDILIFQFDRPDHLPGSRETATAMQVVPATDHLQFWGLDPSQEFNFGSGNKFQGFGMPFARLYAKKFLQPGRKVLIVPAAMGGSSISLWLGLHPASAAVWEYASTNLYPDFKMRVDAALALPGGENRIVALLWHQGETDITFSTLDPHPEGMNDAQTYRSRFILLMTKIRQEYPSTQLYPIIAGEVVSGWQPNAATVTAKANFANMMIDLVQNPPSVLAPFGFVRSSGLNSNYEVDSGTNDPIHFSSASLVSLGGRYFNLYSAIKP